MTREFCRFSKYDRKRSEHSGFTLVELIVVLVLIGILASFSVGGLVGYTRNAAYRRNTENARTVFHAAQSALTYYKASGKIKDLEKAVNRISHSPAYALIPGGPEFIPSTRTGTDKEMSYLMLSKGSLEDLDLSEVKALKDMSEEELLFELLRDYITESSIYNASICVEFDAVDGTVYGVWYSDRAEQFRYTDGDGMQIGQAEARIEPSDYRKDNGLGYYSSMLRDREPRVHGKLEIENVVLRNADTLDLIWYPKDEVYQNRLQEISYTIHLYDIAQSDEVMGKEEKKKVTIEMKPGEDGLLPLSAVEDEKARVQAEVTLFDSDGKEYKEKLSLSFHAYMANYQDETKNNQAVYLTLDAVDAYLAQAQTADSLDDQAVQSTYSARRLSIWDGENHYGLDLDDAVPIRAEVTASYKEEVSAPKPSNTANLLFAEPVVKTETAENQEEEPEPVKTGEGEEAVYVYGIENARHLYNVRFREADEHYKSREITYELRKNIAWGGIGEANQLKKDIGKQKAGEEEQTLGLLSYTSHMPEGGAVTLEAGDVYTKFFYRGTVIQGADTSDENGETKAAYPAFPSIVELAQNHTLTSAEREKYVIPEEEELYVLKEGDGEETRETKGFVISNLALEHDAVLGKDTPDENSERRYVGLVQTNKGIVSKLILKDADVRGISKKNANLAADFAGAFCGANAGEISSVKTVGGMVTGGKNVGGIAGSCFAEDKGAGDAADDGPGENITYRWLDYCVNDADVTGMESVGGIVGRASCVNEDGTDRTDAAVGIRFCANTGMIYGWTEENAENGGPEEDAGDEETGEENIPKYIGGIAGYLGAGSGMTECIGSSVPEELEDRNNQDNQDNQDNEGGEQDPVLSEEEEETLRKKYGHGNYVGGLVGFADDNAPDTETRATITKCTTEGYVIGQDYVGGVIGWNQAGTSNTEAKKVSVYGRDYTGGFSGYNRHNISDTSTVEDVVVKGRHYTGGFLGCNVNASACASMEKRKMLVTLADGECYVGGYIGGNFFSDDNSTTTIHLNQTILPCQKVSGTAFVGGLIGYECSWDAEENASDLVKQAEELKTAFGEESPAIVTLSDEQAAALQFIMNVSDEEGQGRLSCFTGDEASLKEEETAEVSGSVFAGGLIGYIAPNSRTEIKNVEIPETVSVKASHAIRTFGELAERYEENTGDEQVSKAYSFSGSITGYVTKNTVIQYCASKGRAETVGTHTGGLAEINEGNLTECRATGLENTDQLYLGGLVGINGYTGSGENVQRGRIQNCYSDKDCTIAGRGLTGGLAAENYGEIVSSADKKQQTAKVVSSDLYAGGIAGRNAKCPNTETAGVIQDVSVTVEVEGLCAGSIAGTNEGRIERCRTVKEEDKEGLVAAGIYAGGIAGCNAVGGIIESCQVNSCTVKMAEKAETTEVVGETGTAVGLVTGQNEGEILLNFEIDDKRNASIGTDADMPKLQMAGADYAGTIAGTNTRDGIVGDDTKSVVIYELDDEEGQAKDSMGGIVGRSEGLVKNVDFAGTFSGHGNEKNYGGIVGCNSGENGIVENCWPGTGTMEGGTEIAADWNNCLGGVVGYNTQQAKLVGYSGRDAGSSVEHAVVLKLAEKETDTMSSKSALGGLIGINDSTKSMENLENGVQFVISNESKRSGPTGGLIGIQKSGIALTNLVNQAENAVLHSSSSIAGGIIGLAEINEGTLMLEGLQNRGKIAGDSDTVGGIIGEVRLNGKQASLDLKEKELLNSSNTADIFTAGDNAGGLIGRMSLSGGANAYLNHLLAGATGEEPAERNNVTAKGNGSGGFVGYCEILDQSRLTINNSSNSMSVSGQEYVGGMVGQLMMGSGGWITLASDVINAVSISGTERVGGIVGQIGTPEETEAGDISVTIKGCENHGDISAEELASGMIGFAEAKAKMDICLEGDENHGRVRTQNSAAGAGIAVIGKTNADTAVLFDRCVNAGEDDSSYGGGGIGTLYACNTDSDTSYTGGTDSGTPKMEILQCINYSSVQNSNFAGIYAEIKADGTIDTEAGNADKITIGNCICAADAARPIAVPVPGLEKEITDNLYYVSEEETEESTEADEPETDGSETGEEISKPCLPITKADVSLGVAVHKDTGLYNVPGKENVGEKTENTEQNEFLKWKEEQYGEVLDAQMKDICANWPGFTYEIGSAAPENPGEQESQSPEETEKQESQSPEETEEQESQESEETEEQESQGSEQTEERKEVLSEDVISAPDIETDIAESEHEMITMAADGILLPEESGTVVLNHPMITWLQSGETSSGEDAGYRIQVYTLLDSEVKNDSVTYRYPEMTIDLLKNPEGDGYHLERALTARELAGWQEENPGQEVPAFCHYNITVEQNEELYRQEKKKNADIQKAYEIPLGEYELGDKRYQYTYEQQVEGVGTRIIEGVCAVLQILEYKDHTAMIRLLLPDVEQTEEFLYDYTQIIKTQSVTVEALRQSKFEPAEESAAAQKRQWVRLIKKDTMGQAGWEEVMSLRRLLEPDEEFDKKTEPETLGFQNAHEYVILPRNYGTELIKQSGMAAELAFAAESEIEMDSLLSEEELQNYGRDEILFEDETGAGDGSVVIEDETNWDETAGGTEWNDGITGGTEWNGDVTGETDWQGGSWEETRQAESENLAEDTERMTDDAAVGLEALLIGGNARG